MLFKNFPPEWLEALLSTAEPNGLPLVIFLGIDSADKPDNYVGMWLFGNDVSWSHQMGLLLIGWSKVFVYCVIIGQADPWSQFFWLVVVSMRLVWGMAARCPKLICLFVVFITRLGYYRCSENILWPWWFKPLGWLFTLVYLIKGALEIHEKTSCLLFNLENTIFKSLILI